MDADEGSRHYVRGGATFEDFDQFREALVGWDTSPTQLSVGPLRLNYDFIKFRDVTISRMSMNRLLIDPCAHQAGWYNFVVCLSPFVLSGVEVSPGYLMILGPGREYYNIVPAGWRSFEIGLSESVFDDRNSQIPGLRGLAPEASVLPISPGERAAFIRLERDAFDQALSTADGVCSDTDLVDAIRERTLDLLFAVLTGAGWAGEYSVDLRKIAGFDLVNSALRLMFGDPYDPLTVARVSQELGVSQRTLQLAFRRAGLPGPAQVTLAWRLNLSRSALRLGSKSNSSVTEVAMEYGFSHLGRFSQQYRRLFGEMPSKTLEYARRIGRSASPVVLGTSNFSD